MQVVCSGGVGLIYLYLVASETGHDSLWCPFWASRPRGDKLYKKTGVTKELGVRSLFLGARSKLTLVWMGWMDGPSTSPFYSTNDSTQTYLNMDPWPKFMRIFMCVTVYVIATLLHVSCGLKVDRFLRIEGPFTRVPRSVQVWSACAHAFQCEGLQNSHTSLNLSNFFATLHQNRELGIGRFVLNMKIIWCLTLLKKYMPIKWYTKLIQGPYTMHLIIIQLQWQSALWFLVHFQVSKILARSMFSIGRPHNDTHIHASNVSSFNQLLQSLVTQLCLENLRSHIAMLAKPKLQPVPSWSCRVKNARVIGIWKCLLGCHSYWNPTMFLFANCSHCIAWQAIFGETFTVKGGNFAEHIFVKCSKQ